MDNFWSGTGKPGLEFAPGNVELFRRAEVIVLGHTTEWTQPAVWLVTCFQLQRYYKLLLVSRVFHLCTQITVISVIIIYVKTVQSNGRKPCYRRENRAMPYQSKFTAASRGFHCDSTTFVSNIGKITTKSRCQICLFIAFTVLQQSLVLTSRVKNDRLTSSEVWTVLVLLRKADKNNIGLLNGESHRIQRWISYSIQRNAVKLNNASGY